MAMKRGILVSMFLALALGCSGSDDKKDGKVKDRTQPSAVTLDDLKSTPPDSWIEETPTSSLRFAQFRLPRAEGDSADADLIIFRGIGGDAEQNINRWKNDQFIPPEGKKIDDVATVKEITIGDRKAKLLDVTGTYKDSGGRPGMGTVTKRPGYRLIGIHFDGPRTVYHIKLTGPAATVEKHKKEFDQWLKSFK
jgi:hypothetical protein